MIKRPYRHYRPYLFHNPILCVTIKIFSAQPEKVFMGHSIELMVVVAPVDDPVPQDDSPRATGSSQNPWVVRERRRQFQHIENQATADCACARSGRPPPASNGNQSLSSECRSNKSRPPTPNSTSRGCKGEDTPLNPSQVNLDL